MLFEKKVIERVAWMGALPVAYLDVQQAVNSALKWVLKMVVK